MTSKQPGRKPLQVLLLAGGPSAEREVSLKSGAAVADALRSRGHSVVHFDPRAERLDGVETSAFDVAFIALHGRYGEDGTVQAQLDALRIPYTGSGRKASALAFCKSAAKQQFIDHGVPTPQGFVFRSDDTLDDCVIAAKVLGLPVVVKPDRQGSSIGISFASRTDELPKAIEVALGYDSQGLIEVAIAGEEWTVPLLDELVLPPIRIATPAAFFDYEAKYFRGDTSYDFPEDVDADQLHRITSAAVMAAHSLGVTGLSRVDLRVDEQGQAWVLEVNTIPGLTDHSLAPKSAERMGMSLADLCEEMCWRALFGGPHTRVTPHSRQVPQVPFPIRRAS